MTAFGPEPAALPLAAFLPPAQAALVDTLHFHGSAGHRCGREEGIALSGLATGPLRSFLTIHSGACPRAVLSLWSRWYLLALLPPVVVAVLAAGRDVPLAPAEVRLLCTPDGRPTGLVLPHEGRPAEVGDPAASLLPLRTHLEALAMILGAAGLPRPVLWGNAAATLRWMVDVLTRSSGGGCEDAPPHRVASGSSHPSIRAGQAGLVLATVLASPCWSDGMPNHLAGQLRPASARTVPRRRTCCLRSRLPGQVPCVDCPCIKGAG